MRDEAGCGAVAIDYGFVRPGTDATSTPGRVYVDVGNRFMDGVLDHHGPDTPARCTAELVLAYPRMIRSQVGADRRVLILTHQEPDLDAISGVYFVRAHLCGEAIDEAARTWAAYVCDIDRGDTGLDPRQPIGPYSVLMLALRQVREAVDDPDMRSRRMLEAGLGFVANMLHRLRQGFRLDDPAIVTGVSAWAAAVQAVRDDHAAYLEDLARAELFPCALPRTDGRGLTRVPGVWIRRPRSALFKSWARGDTGDTSRPRGFILTGVELGKARTIISVAPGRGVNLKGLGDRLEAAETAKRARLGRPRTGPVRPGYHTSDPWYDGRAPLHDFTIVDAPRSGTLLSAKEIRAAFDAFLADAAGAQAADAGLDVRPGP